MTDPECSEERKAPPTRPEEVELEVEARAEDDARTIRQAWRCCGSRLMKTGFVLAIVTLVLCVIDAAIALYLMVWLLSPGFKGGTAGMALLYAPFFWFVALLPLGIITIILIALNRPGKGVRVLRSRAYVFTLVGLAGSFLIIVAPIFILVAMA